jgi:site-specific DNA-methyltransferase (adenine-specific)
MRLAEDTIHLGDCIEGMRHIGDGTVDLVLSDLPYEITANEWDRSLPLSELWIEFKRILAPQGGVVLTAAQPFTSALVESNRSMFRAEWIWSKPTATGFLNAHRLPLRTHESVLVFGPVGMTYNPQGLQPLGRIRRSGPSGTNYRAKGTEWHQEWTNYPRSVIEFPHDPARLHPTQKPVGLMEYFVRTYSNPGELVLDGCMGSGTTAIACLNSGRRFIGFENDPQYHATAMSRIESARGRGPVAGHQARSASIEHLFV